MWRCVDPGLYTALHGLWPGEECGVPGAAQRVAAGGQLEQGGRVPVPRAPQRPGGRHQGQGQTPHQHAHTFKSLKSET